MARGIYTPMPIGTTGPPSNIFRIRFRERCSTIHPIKVTKKASLSGSINAGKHSWRQWLKAGLWRPQKCSLPRQGTGPGDRWLQRTINQGGLQLAGVRDRILAAAEIERHSNVLDLNAGTGLLTWEAVRRSPEGSVWALVSDERTASGLRAQASNLREMDRPVIMAGPLERILGLVSAKGEGDVRFDAVVGRNALLPVHDKGTVVKAVTQVLAPEGTISLVEGVPRRGQRIYGLADLEGLDRKLVEKWIAAEETIYEDADDPMVNWIQDDLAHAFDQAGLIIKHFHSEPNSR